MNFSTYLQRTILFHCSRGEIPSIWCYNIYTRNRW